MNNNNSESDNRDFKQTLSLEDRSILFLMILFGCLATQTGLFFKFLYERFFSNGERISDVINSTWKWGEYLSGKLGAFGWITDCIKKVVAFA